MNINGVLVDADPTLSNDEITDLVNKELQLWRQQEKVLGAIVLTLEGNTIVVQSFETAPIKRIQRITGDSSTLDHFNTTKPSQRQEYFSKVLREMPFAQRLGFEVREIQKDRVILEMPIVAEQHANLLGVVHGGVLMSLADTVMGFACANQGSMPTTVDMNINFLKRIKAEGSIWAIASILHHGRHTIVVEAEIYSKDSELAAKARGTFYIMGKVEEILKEE